MKIPICVGRNTVDFQKPDKELLLQIFPLEIWLTIFDHAHSDEIQKTLSASRAFEQMVDQSRVQHLFPDVIQLLLPYFPKQSNSFDGNKMFLQCRQVCRFWKIGVDKLFQDPTHHICIDGGRSVWDVVHLFRINITIGDGSGYNEKTVQQFENHFQASHLATRKNPFISRRVTIRIPLPRDRNEEYFQQLAQMLTRFGHHVWYLTLILDDYAPGGNYPEVRTLLQQLPNMNSLNFSHQTRRAQEPWNPLQLEPFPTYTNLKYLRGCEKHTEFYEAFLSNNRHISVLEIEESQYRDGSFLSAESMPYLGQLQIRFGESVNLQALQNAQLFWSLGKLVVDLMWTEWEAVGRVFQFLELKFSSTLNELKITFPYKKCEMNNVSLCLPHLKSFTVEILHPIPVEFILPMKNNLEYLCVDSISGSPLSAVDFREHGIPGFFSVGTSESLEKWNIWQVFSKLKEIQYANGKFTLRRKTT